MRVRKMRFRLDAANTCECETGFLEFLNENDFKPEYDSTNFWYTLSVDIDSLDKLMLLINSYREIVVYKDRLLIYNDYIE